MLKQQEDIAREETGAAFTLTNLSDADIWPSGFQRKRVKHSSKILSENISSSFIAYKQKSQMFEPSHATAILLSETGMLLIAVKNYNLDQALSATNISTFKRFQNIVTNYAHVIVCAKFIRTHFHTDFPENYKLPKSAIKPIQSSVADSSASVITLTNRKKNARNFFTANITQDPVESLFGELRADGCENPTPRRVLQLLKFRILTFYKMCNKNCQLFTSSETKELISNFNSSTRQVV